MISLDKKILDPSSAVAARMVEHGKEEELFIIVPSKEAAQLDLSAQVHVAGSGGSKKISQLWKLYRLGYNLIKTNEPDSITTQDPFFSGLIGLFLKQKFKIPLEVQVHGDFYAPSNYYRWGGWFHRERWWLGLMVLSYADTVRVMSERVRASLVNGLRLNESKIFVRPIAVDSALIKNYEPKINLHNCYPGFKKIFLCLGRLDPVKNIPWLIRLFVEIIKWQPEYLLLVVGSGPDKDKITALIKELHLEKNIKLEDWTNDPLSYIKTADGALFPSLSEGYGLVPMEAHYVGTPLIMNDVGVANYELKPNDKARPRTVPSRDGTSAWVKILPINDKEKWIEAILSI